MILIYKKNGKTSIIETKTICYEILPIIDANGQDTGNKRISLELMVDTNTGVHIETLDFFARDAGRVKTFEDLITNAINDGIIDTRNYNGGKIE